MKAIPRLRSLPALPLLLLLPGCFSFSVWQTPPETVELPATVLSISRATAPATTHTTSVLFIEYRIDAPRGSPSATPVNLPAQGIVEITADANATERLLLVVRSPASGAGRSSPSITLHLCYSRGPANDRFQAVLERKSFAPGTTPDAATVIDLTAPSCRIRDRPPDPQGIAHIDWPADVPPRMTFLETRPCETPRLAGRILATPAAVALDVATLPLQTLLVLVAYVQALDGQKRGSGFMRP